MFDNNTYNFLYSTISIIRGETMIIRQATKNDAIEISEIYAHYVENTSATFEYIPPSVSEMQNRIAATLLEYPFIVCIVDDEIIGFAYAARHLVRTAYRFNAVLSVYLKPSATGKGYGIKLYDSLISILKEQNICNLYGCISAENEASIRMHEKLGFTKNALFTKTGYKFNRWIDVVWLEKRISDDVSNEFIPYRNLNTLHLFN